MPGFSLPPGNECAIFSRPGEPCGRDEARFSRRSRGGVTGDRPGESVSDGGVHWPPVSRSGGSPTMVDRLFRTILPSTRTGRVSRFRSRHGATGTGRAPGPALFEDARRALRRIQRRYVTGTPTPTPLAPWQFDMYVDAEVDGEATPEQLAVLEADPLGVARLVARAAARRGGAPRERPLAAGRGAGAGHRRPRVGAPAAGRGLGTRISGHDAVRSRRRAAGVDGPQRPRRPRRRRRPRAEPGVVELQVSWEPGRVVAWAAGRNTPVAARRRGRRDARRRGRAVDGLDAATAPVPVPGRRQRRRAGDPGRRGARLARRGGRGPSRRRRRAERPLVGPGRDLGGRAHRARRDGAVAAPTQAAERHATRLERFVLGALDARARRSRAPRATDRGDARVRCSRSTRDVDARALDPFRAHGHGRRDLPRQRAPARERPRRRRASAPRPMSPRRSSPGSTAARSTRRPGSRGEISARVERWGRSVTGEHGAPDRAARPARRLHADLPAFRAQPHRPGQIPPGRGGRGVAVGAIRWKSPGCGWRRPGCPPSRSPRRPNGPPQPLPRR